MRTTTYQLESLQSKVSRKVTMNKERAIRLQKFYQEQYGINKELFFDPVHNCYRLLRASEVSQWTDEEGRQHNRAQRLVPVA